MKRLKAIAARLPFEALFAAVTLYSARPAFASLHLPLQDLPQHMAAIAVLKRYAVDAGLRQYVELTLSKTQYLFVYALGVPLSIPFGVEYATRLLVALTVVALPYALRYALKRTGGDERFAAMAWPFAWNPQMMLGFLNFLLGIPLALWCIGLFADPDGRTKRRRQIGLALLALGAFYSHLVAYGLLGLGVLMLLDTRGLAAPARRAWEASRDARPPARAAGAARALGAAAWARAGQWTSELVFLVPSLLAAAVWIVRSPARDAQVRAGGVGREIVLTWPDRTALPGEFRDTLLNLQGDADEKALLAWGLALMAALALSRVAGERDRAERAGATEEAGGPTAEPALASRGRVAWLPFACAVLYIVSPASYGWIWPIHTRFSLAAVLLLPLAFRRARGRVLPWAVLLGLAFVTVPMTTELAHNFQRWDREEFGDLDAALAHARPGRRLVALVPPLRSQYVPGNVPTLHAAAYYQVRGGHVATFSFADFPQSPFRYREDGPRPPRLRPRWEWETNMREADPDRSYYDYVLTRAGGFGDEAAQMPALYERVYEGSEWNLYERRRGNGGAASPAAPGPAQ